MLHLGRLGVRCPGGGRDTVRRPGSRCPISATQCEPRFHLAGNLGGWCWMVLRERKRVCQCLVGKICRRTWSNLSSTRSTSLVTSCGRFSRFWALRRCLAASRACPSRWPCLAWLTGAASFWRAWKEPWPPQHGHWRARKLHRCLGVDGFAMFCPFLALGLLASKNLYQNCIFCFRCFSGSPPPLQIRRGFESGCSSKILVDSASKWLLRSLQSHGYHLAQGVDMPILGSSRSW